MALTAWTGWTELPGRDGRRPTRGWVHPPRSRSAAELKLQPPSATEPLMEARFPSGLAGIKRFVGFCAFSPRQRPTVNADRTSVENTAFFIPQMTPDLWSHRSVCTTQGEHVAGWRLRLWLHHGTISSISGLGYSLSCPNVKH
ncbi:hypothetical protein AAFF_G00053510 [Aldrovandia affinis]|uniref:Uncharacterized protein n=1 Tax=Aldrovandia affinis TaxID=143900 RepID=A0AAD7S118_9TELE|nr:hypothetical protein AAFF_G00053510 [Aldrovandia affinis]